MSIVAMVESDAPGSWGSSTSRRAAAPASANAGARLANLTDLARPASVPRTSFRVERTCRPRLGRAVHEDDHQALVLLQSLSISWPGSRASLYGSGLRAFPFLALSSGSTWAPSTTVMGCFLHADRDGTGSVTCVLLFGISARLCRTGPWILKCAGDLKTQSSVQHVTGCMLETARVFDRILVISM
jgi:hypothetical protein